MNNILESYNEIKVINKNELAPLLLSTPINNPRANINKFLEKLNEDNTYIGLFDIDNQLLSLCILVYNRTWAEDFYLNGIESFTKGSGKQLINYLIKNYDNLWLRCDPDSSNDLVNYYKQFNMLEYKVFDENYNKDVYFFINRNYNADFNDLTKFINKAYGYKNK